MSGDENAAQQCDEIEAVSSIYGDDFKVEDLSKCTYSLKVQVAKLTVTLLVTLPYDYPSKCPPRYDLDALWLRGALREQLQSQLESLYLEHTGECVLYLWAEKIREFLQELSDVEAATEQLNEVTVDESKPSSSDHSNEVIDCPEITSGELIIDRKSVFQSHLARVTSPAQVPIVLSKLKENKKINSATHNIFAYRVRLPSGLIAQDCEDDGEIKAGSRMLHLLSVLDVMDVLVIVTRWYGGCHLGPDRFKHINTAARNIIQQCGLLEGSHHDIRNTDVGCDSALDLSASSSARKTKHKSKLRR